MIEEVRKNGQEDTHFAATLQEGLRKKKMSVFNPWTCSANCRCNVCVEVAENLRQYAINKKNQEEKFDREILATLKSGELSDRLTYLYRLTAVSTISVEVLDSIYELIFDPNRELFERSRALQAVRRFPISDANLENLIDHWIENSQFKELSHLLTDDPRSISFACGRYQSLDYDKVFEVLKAMRDVFNIHRLRALPHLLTWIEFKDRYRHSHPEITQELTELFSPWIEK